MFRSYLRQASQHFRRFLRGVVWTGNSDTTAACLGRIAFSARMRLAVMLAVSAVRSLEFDHLHIVGQGLRASRKGARCNVSADKDAAERHACCTCRMHTLQHTTPTSTAYQMCHKRCYTTTHQHTTNVATPPHTNTPNEHTPARTRAAPTCAPCTIAHAPRSQTHHGILAAGVGRTD